MENRSEELRGCLDNVLECAEKSGTFWEVKDQVARYFAVVSSALEEIEFLTSNCVLRWWFRQRISLLKGIVDVHAALSLGLAKDLFISVATPLVNKVISKGDSEDWVNCGDTEIVFKYSELEELVKLTKELRKAIGLTEKE